MLSKIIASILIFVASSFYFFKTGDFSKDNLETAQINVQPASVALNTQEQDFFIRPLLPIVTPIRNWKTKDLEINIKSAIAFYLGDGLNPEIKPVLTTNQDTGQVSDELFNRGIVLYQKNIDEKLPIASLTKLASAVVALENLNQDDYITVSKEAVASYGEMGNLTVGEDLKVIDALKIMLMESSNDASVALAEAVNVKNSEKTDSHAFVNLMQKLARDLNLKATNFSDPSGLEISNVSSVRDLTILTYQALSKEIIWEIMRLSETDIFSKDGKFLHHLTNSNKLLEKIEGIYGGKTGYTNEAGECMILVLNAPNGNGKIILVILGAPEGERFSQIEKLVNWLKEAYIW